MNAIVVVDKNWAIGREGGLLVHLPGDLKYYKEKTIGNITILGRKTLETFPGKRPLPGRLNIILTRNTDYVPNENEKSGEWHLCSSKEDVLKTVDEFKEARNMSDDQVFVAGGAQIYKQFLDDCDTFYVTKIDAEFEADAHFPNLDELGMHIEWQSEPQEENGYTYRFLKYVR